MRYLPVPPFSLSTSCRSGGKTMRSTDENVAARPQEHVQEWAEGVYELFKMHHVELISFVPDSGHKQLIAFCQSDPALHMVMLTTEEEGTSSHEADVFGQCFV